MVYIHNCTNLVAIQFIVDLLSPVMFHISSIRHHGYYFFICVVETCIVYSLEMQQLSMGVASIQQCYKQA